MLKVEKLIKDKNISMTTNIRIVKTMLFPMVMLTVKPGTMKKEQQKDRHFQKGKT